MSNQCKYCGKKLKSRRKEFCNNYCETIFQESHNIRIPKKLFNRLKELNDTSLIKEIQEISNKQNLNPRYVHNKFLFLKKNNERVQ